MSTEVETRNAANAMYHADLAKLTWLASCRLKVMEGYWNEPLVRFPDE